MFVPLTYFGHFICFGNYYRPGQRFVIIVASVVVVVIVVALAPLFINLPSGD